MGMKELIASAYLSFVQSDNIRYTTRPAGTGVVGVAVTAGKAVLGAYAQIVAAALITNPSWLCGCSFDTIVDLVTDTASTERAYDIRLATGAACAEVDIGSFGFGLSHVRYSAVGEINSYLLPVWLPYPVRLNGQPRIAARAGSTDCAATHAVGVKVILATAVGT